MGFEGIIFGFLDILNGRIVESSPNKATARTKQGLFVRPVGFSGVFCSRFRSDMGFSGVFRVFPKNRDSGNKKPK